MATKLALIKLKGRTTKGEASVPLEDRVYFTVNNDCDVWMSKEWTLGKAIDFIGKQQTHPGLIKNRNNVKDDEPKLHLFNKDDKCISNPSGRKISEIIEEGLIVDGDKLLFKYCCLSHADKQQ
jgi:hypothetical protein